MQAPTPSTIAILVLSPFLAWRVYSRFRRSVGRQKLSRFFHWVTLAIFSLVSILLAYAGREQVASLGSLALGLGMGALLGLYGLRLTRFEATSEGVYFTPNAPLGIALSVLFVGRITQRLIAFTASQTPAGPGHATFVRSPLTLVVFGLLAGYYIAYAVGLLRWRNPAPGLEPPVETLATDG